MKTYIGGLTANEIAWDTVCVDGWMSFLVDWWVEFSVSVITCLARCTAYCVYVFPILSPVTLESLVPCPNIKKNLLGCWVVVCGSCLYTKSMQ